MSRITKNSIITIIYFLISINCIGQTNNKDFNIFLSKFTDFSFPVNTIDFIAYREGLIQTWNISKDDYNTFLRRPNDKFWKFNECFSYTFGGKHKQDNYWILFYSRHFMPDNVNEQKGEFILLTYSLGGSFISEYPIAGGYGDTLTFSSIMYSQQKIEVKYIKYANDIEEAYIKYYGIDEKGHIHIVKDNE